MISRRVSSLVSLSAVLNADVEMGKVVAVYRHVLDGEDRAERGAGKETVAGGAHRRVDRMMP